MNTLYMLTYKNAGNQIKTKFTFDTGFVLVFLLRFLLLCGPPLPPATRCQDTFVDND